MVVIKLRKSRTYFQPNGGADEQRRYGIGKEFFVPGIIILTSILLYIVPFSVYRLVPYERTRLYYIIGRVCHLLQIIGLIVDPVTYILLSKNYREAITKKLLIRNRNEAYTITNEQGRTESRV